MPNPDHDLTILDRFAVDTKLAREGWLAAEVVEELGEITQADYHSAGALFGIAWAIMRLEAAGRSNYGGQRLYRQDQAYKLAAATLSEVLAAMDRATERLDRVAELRAANGADAPPET